MIIDALNKVSAAQAVTATAASTDSIDWGEDREMGVGEPLALVVGVVAVTPGSITALTIAWQADDNSGFSSPRSISSTDAIPIAEVTLGRRFVVPLPPDYRNERYGRANYTIAGSGGTITLDAFIQPLRMVQAEAVYPKNYNITG